MNNETKRAFQEVLEKRGMTISDELLDKLPLVDLNAIYTIVALNLKGND